MPRQLRDLTRRQRVAGAAAADFGADRPFHYSSGDYYSREASDALAQLLLGRLQLKEDFLLTVSPTSRSVRNLLNDLDRVLRKFGVWWGKRHRVGPDGEAAWLNYFVVSVPSEAGHASHAHIVFSEYLSDVEQGELVRRIQKRSRKEQRNKMNQHEPVGTPAINRDRELQATFSGNSEAWLQERPRAKGHTSKVFYAARHCQKANADYRISADPAPWAARTRARFKKEQRRRRRGSTPVDTPAVEAAASETQPNRPAVENAALVVGRGGSRQSAFATGSKGRTGSLHGSNSGSWRSRARRTAQGIISSVWASIRKVWCPHEPAGGRSREQTQAGTDRRIFEPG